MKIIQINTTVNSCSTGRITEQVGQVLISKGHESYIAFGRDTRPSESKLIKVGNKRDLIRHGLKTRIFDRHGFSSNNATKTLIKELDTIKPDAIGLFNLHGYYLNIEVLFNYLRLINIPVIWTLFDCWAFTGHCSYFDDINCTKWINGCYSCPKTKVYPSSYFLDNSKRNYLDKKAIFTGIDKLHLIVHSQWLKRNVGQSFLKDYPVHQIFSGVDLDVFKPKADNNIRRKYSIGTKKIILGVANIWDTRKGLADFIKIHDYFVKDYVMILVGLTKKQIKALPAGIIGIERTESVEDLASFYCAADVFVNPTYLDNFPTTNLEALACGTPVVTYDTGGSPEAIDQNTGRVIKKGDIKGLKDGILEIFENSKEEYKLACRGRAEHLFNKDHRFLDYLHLYEELT